MNKGIIKISKIAYLYFPAYRAKKYATGYPNKMQQNITNNAKKIVLTNVFIYISSIKNSL